MQKVPAADFPRAYSLPEPPMPFRGEGEWRAAHSRHGVDSDQPAAQAGDRAGRLRSAVDACGSVVFSAAGMGRLLPGATALNFSVECASVVVYGTAQVVDGAEEATHGLRRLMEKYAPHLRYGVDYQGIPAKDLERTAVCRVDIEAWSGKQKEAAPDYPGAYTLPEPPVPFPERTPG